MQKIFTALFIFLFLQNASDAISFGAYKPQTEYGLIDGFKFNFRNREKGQKLIEIKSETKEEQERLERERKKPKQEIDENEMYRFMRDGVNPI